MVQKAAPTNLHTCFRKCSIHICSLGDLEKQGIPSGCSAVLQLDSVLLVLARQPTAVAAAKWALSPPPHDTSPRIASASPNTIPLATGLAAGCIVAAAVVWGWEDTAQAMRAGESLALPKAEDSIRSSIGQDIWLHRDLPLQCPYIRPASWRASPAGPLLSLPASGGPPCACDGCCLPLITSRATCSALSGS